MNSDIPIIIQMDDHEEPQISSTFQDLISSLTQKPNDNEGFEEISIDLPQFEVSDFDTPNHDPEPGMTFELESSQKYHFNEFIFIYIQRNRNVGGKGKA